MQHYQIGFSMWLTMWKIKYNFIFLNGRKYYLSKHAYTRPKTGICILTIKKLIYGIVLFWAWTNMLSLTLCQKIKPLTLSKSLKNIIASVTDPVTYGSH